MAIRPGTLPVVIKYSPVTGATNDPVQRAEYPRCGKRRGHRWVDHAGFQVRARLHAPEFRLALQIGIVKVLGQKSMFGTMGRRERIARYHGWRLRRVRGAECEANLGLAGELALDSIQRRHVLAREAIVIPQQGDGVVRRRTDHGDPAHGGLQRQSLVFIFQQYDRLARRFQRELAVFLGIVLRIRDLRKRYALGGIEHAEFEARHEQPLERAVDFALRDLTGFHGINQRPVLVSAGEVGTGLHRHCGRFRGIGLVLVAAEDVGDRAAIADDVAWEAPLIPQALLEEVETGARGHAIHAVVGAHHGVGFALHDGGFESRQISIFEIAFTRFDVEFVARAFGPAVDREVFGGRDDLEIVRILALQSFDERHGHAAGEERIFAIGLLAAAPARIAKDVDVGRPEGEAEVAGVVVVANGLVVFRARFGGDDVGDAVNQIGVESGRESDRLREDSGLTGTGDAVQGFVPPVVSGNVETPDGRRAVLHLQDLLFERQARYKIGRALLRRRGPLPGFKYGWLPADCAHRTRA